MYMLDQIEDFGGCFPFFSRYDCHDGMIGLMRISHHPHSLIGCENELVKKKHGEAAKAFVSGRRCIRALQKRLGLPEFELSTAEFGPMWPKGLVGSISHSRELAAATILRDALGVGIDIECQRRLKSDAVRRVATKEEYSRYSVVPDFDWTLLFSAKESVFKAFSPLAKRYIGFQEIELLLDVATQSFSLRYLGNTIDKGLFEKSEGHWSSLAGHVITLVMVE